MATAHDGARVMAGWKKHEAMHSLDWSTGNGRFEFVTSGLSEDQLGLLEYDLEISDTRRLLWGSNSEGHKRRCTFPHLAPTLSRSACCRVEPFPVPRSAAKLF